ncbi:MAG TPA: SDR family NAD(P)-dependent oxidoreductase, partial [Acidimicrobiia bacterium]|nr:SDR family NAD(P)-dependent oxidoreductase [Acidimicrobiia bacterium]
MELEGKVAIVTGASRGVGKQIAIELATRGADVVVAARTVEPRRRLPGTIGETVEAVEALGRRAVAVQADVSVEDDLVKVVDTAVAELGRIDVLVNNAAYTSGKAWGLPLLELSRNDWHRQFATNLDAAFTLVQAVVPHMRDQGGGVIVNLTSAAGDLVAGGGGGGEESVMGTAPLAYASSKAALNRFANAVAGQLRPMGIAIVNVEPGFVRTEMVDI